LSAAQVHDNNPPMFKTHPLQKLSQEKLRFIFLFSLFMSAGIGIYFHTIGHALVHDQAKYGIISLEFSWSLQGFQEITRPWSDFAHFIALKITWMDFAFLALYSQVFASLALMSGKGAMAASMAWASWIAASCDIIENVASLKLLLGTPTEPWPFFMSLAASIKFALLGIVLAYLFFSAAKRLLCK
jgi:hypothetical protein